MSHEKRKADEANNQVFSGESGPALSDGADSSAAHASEACPELAVFPIEDGLSHDEATQLRNNERSKRLEERALGFLLRGVIHKLNNVFAVFSSHTQLLALRKELGQKSQVTRDTTVLQSSLAKGAKVMDILGSLLNLDREDSRRCPKTQESLGMLMEESGRSEQSKICLGPLMKSLSDLLLCEIKGERYPVTVVSEPQVYVCTERSSLIALISLLVEHVLLEAAATYVGNLVIQVVAEREGFCGPQIRVGFELPENYLPFRIDERRLDTDLVEFARSCGIKVEREHATGSYALHFAPV